MEENLISRFHQQFEAYYARKMTRSQMYCCPTSGMHENQGPAVQAHSHPLHRRRHQPHGHTADIAEAVQTNAKSIRRDIEKAVTPSIIDESGKNTCAPWTNSRIRCRLLPLNRKTRWWFTKWKPITCLKSSFTRSTRGDCLTSQRAPRFCRYCTLEEAREQRTDLSKVRPTAARRKSRRRRRVSRRSKPQTV